MNLKSPERIKNSKEDDKKSKLLSFIKRHNSNTRVSPKSIHPTLTYSKTIKRESTSKSPNRGSSMDLKKSISRKSPLTDIRKSSSKLDIFSECEISDKSTSEFLTNLKEKLEKIEESSIAVENWKEILALKEKELVAREAKIREIEKENEKNIAERLKNLEKKEKDLKSKEEKIFNMKNEMFAEVSKSLQKKSKEIARQEEKLNLAIEKLSIEMKKLEKMKEDIAKSECVVLLNEIIGSIVLSDFQNKVNEYKFVNKFDSFDENTLSDFYSSINEFDRIDEASNESSIEYESYSTEYMKRRDKILNECEEITKENSEISKKLENLIDSLKIKEENYCND